MNDLLSELRAQNRELYENLETPTSVKEAIHDMHKRIQMLEADNAVQNAVLSKINDSTDQILMITKTTKSLFTFFSAVKTLCTWISAVGAGVLVIWALIISIYAGHIFNIPPTTILPH